MSSDPIPYTGDIKAIRAHHWAEIQDWCRIYQDFGPMRQGPLTRFNIGLYQIGQGTKWENQHGEVACQSYLAACLHFIMVSTAVDGCALTLPHTDLDSNRNTWVPLNYQDILEDVCECSRMLVYHSHGAGSTRKSRFSPRILSAKLESLVLRLYDASVTSAATTSDMIYNETVLMTDDLLARKRADR